MLVKDKRKEWERLGMGPEKRARMNVVTREANRYNSFPAPKLTLKFNKHSLDIDDMLIMVPKCQVLTQGCFFHVRHL